MLKLVASANCPLRGSMYCQHEFEAAYTPKAITWVVVLLGEGGSECVDGGELLKCCWF